MATFTKKQSFARRLTGAPYGDMLAISDFNFTTNSSGAVTDSDAGAAVAFAISDIARIGIIPAGTKLLDYIGVVSDAFTASSTMDLGFAYVDGVDSTAVPQDADYFAAGAALSSLAVLRKTTTTPPVVLPKDAYLILTGKGANQAAAGVLDITIIGAATGAV